MKRRKLSTKRWYVFQTPPACEFLAERQLRQKQYEVFVPSIIVPKLRLGVQIGEDKRGLFSTYGFVRFNVAWDHWKPICSTYGVKRLFSSSPERPIPLPVGVVESMMEVATAPLQEDETIIVEPLAPIDLVTANENAQVIDGPFAGHVGYVQSASKSRATLLMWILGSQVPVKFKLTNLRKLMEQSYGTQEAAAADTAD